MVETNLTYRKRPIINDGINNRVNEGFFKDFFTSTKDIIDENLFL